MKIAKIHIQNILGIRELEFEPGSLVEITGHNGSGKTSVLAAMKAVIDSGHDATLLRAGEKTGEAVIVLDDGTQLGKRISADASKRFVTLPNGDASPRPASVIESLADLIGVNPVAFLSAAPKDRTRVLLETIPLQIDVQRLKDLMVAGGLEPKIGEGSSHALVIIDAARQKLYDERHALNRALTEKEGTISQLKAALPPPSEAKVGDASALMQDLEALDKARDAEVERVNKKVGELSVGAQTKIAELRAQIEALQAEIAKQEEAIKALKTKAATQLANYKEQYTQKRAQIAAQVESIQRDAAAAARYKVTREIIEKHEGELASINLQSLACTEAIRGIDSYKNELLEKLPIKGLTVTNGEIFRDGIAFERLNEAQRVSIAIEIAKLRAGKLALACVDGLECMDQMTYDEFTKQAKESGVQFFVTRVSNGPFEISSSPFSGDEL